MVNILEIVKTLDRLVNVPIYATLGAVGNNLVYLSTQQGTRGLWAFDLDSKSAKKLTTGPVHEPAIPSPDSPYVIFTRDMAKGRELHKVFYTDVKSGEEKVLADTPLMRIFGIAFDGSKVAFSGATAEDIAIYLVKMNGDWEKLTKLETMAFVTDVSDEYIVGTGNLRKDPRTYEIFVFNLKTNEFKVYTPKEGSQNKNPMVKGSTVLFESNFEGSNKLYLYYPDNDRLEEVSFSHEDYSNFNPVEHEAYGWDSKGNIWAIGKRDGRSKLFIDGREVPTPQGTIHGFPAFVEENAYVAISSVVHPPKILKINLNDGNTEAIIDNPLPDDIAKKFGDVKFVKYKSFDNLEIPAYVIESMASAKPGPGIVYVHGGPWSEVRDSWNLFIASLVATGYHVLAPNFRGSTGYGDDFRTLDIGDQAEETFKI